MGKKISVYVTNETLENIKFLINKLPGGFNASKFFRSEIQKMRNDVEDRK